MASGRTGWRGVAISAVLSLVLGAASFVPVLAGNSAFTEEFDRTGMTYMYMLYQYEQQGVAPRFKTESGEASVTRDGANLWGIGLGYLFTDKIGLRFETVMGSTDFQGTGAAQGISRDVFANTGTFNLDFYPLDQRFTPFFTGGIGWQYIEAALTNIPITPGYCYWDPWWGYICTGGSYPVYSETEFVWNAGLGLRWDAPANFFIKAAIDAYWYKLNDAENYTRNGRFGVSFGVNY